MIDTLILTLTTCMLAANVIADTVIVMGILPRLRPRPIGACGTNDHPLDPRDPPAPGITYEEYLASLPPEDDILIDADTSSSVECSDDVIDAEWTERLEAAIAGDRDLDA